MCVPPATPRHLVGMPDDVVCSLVHSELEIFKSLEELVRDCDPDLLVGYEVQQRSFGYILDRARHIGYPFDRSLSRCPLFPSVLERRPDQYGQQAQSGIHICGREILNVWRVCRGEIKLAMYSYPHVCEKVLNKRVPVYSSGSLHTWFHGAPPSAAHAPPPVPASIPQPAPDPGLPPHHPDPLAKAPNSADAIASAGAAHRGCTAVSSHQGGNEPGRRQDTPQGNEEGPAPQEQPGVAGLTAGASPSSRPAAPPRGETDAGTRTEGGSQPPRRPEEGSQVPDSTGGGVHAKRAAPGADEPAGPGGPTGAAGGQDGATKACATSGSDVDVGRRRQMRRVLLYQLDRAENSLDILDKMELVGRTCELARVFGIDLFSVLSRGSQYRVESMLYRLARSQNYCLVSPSVQQRQSQPATECIPLVMEPMSAFYDSPVCVLDFRSLYPSVVIAYNLCYSTCLGKVGCDADAEGRLKLGVSSLERPPGLLAAVQDDTYVSPNGMIFVQSHVREGVLPRLLREILSARVAVKKLMKEAERANDTQLYRALNARQFGLKLIANVTYGYTSAGFSGRMPCAELADTIVQTGRESLERAIRTVESKKKEWGARVVYGDTDSLFVELPGRSREEAFRIGNDIAAFVTAQNPAPMELELEKVYQPSLMIAKKRYVGYSYESAREADGKLDPKGIEMVRRDGCKLLSRVQEKCLRELFETKDLSRVKKYLESTMTAITTSALNVSDFVFAKEVRAGSYHSATLPPAAVVDDAKRRRDPRAGALYSERVPYVVVCGPPGSRLVDICVDPIDLVNSHGALRINATYYIQKQLLPALERIFSLLGADVRRWYLDMPRSSRDRSPPHPPSLPPSLTSLPRAHLSSSSEGRGRVESRVANPGFVAGGREPALYPPTSL